MNYCNTLLGPDNVKRILAVSTGGLGDTILFSPVFKALRYRYPQAKIELLLTSRLVEMAYTIAREIDHTTVLNINHLTFPLKIIRLIRFALRSRMDDGYDIGVFATGLNPKLSIVLKHVAGTRNIFCAPNPPDYDSDLSCNVALAKQFDDTIGEDDVFIPSTKKSLIEAKEVLGMSGVSWEKERIIAVYPSTNLWHRPRWDIYNLVEVIRLLRENGFCGKVVVVGSSEEGREWDNIDSKRETDANLAGKLSILGSTSLLSKCCLVLCNDGGLMHVAGAVGSPLVVVMPNAPLSYRPPGEKTKVIHSKLSCAAACYPRRPKWCDTAFCTDDIVVEDIFQACIDMLS